MVDIDKRAHKSDKKLQEGDSCPSKAGLRTPSLSIILEKEVGELISS